jgi:3-isopropylmalate dehydrogenase
MKTYNIAVISGDGIGPEITESAVKVLEKLAGVYGFSVSLTNCLLGGIAIDLAGTPLPEETLSVCRRSDAVLMGAVGGSKWDSNEEGMRPENGLLGIRSGLGLYANLRPALLYPALKDASPLRADIVGDGFDILIIRELTGGLYFGKKGIVAGENGERRGFDTEEYAEYEIKRIGRTAFEAARKRSGKLTSIDKANVMLSSRLWRSVITQLGEKEYPDVQLSHLYVDNGAMQLVRDPRQFDTIVTSNLFGDILSDEASQLTGSIGLLPSASLGEGTLGLYEPIHGSAPDIAGKGIANPLAMILSVALMLRYSLGENEAAVKLEESVQSVLRDGVFTIDIAVDKTKFVTTSEMTEAVLDKIG